MVCGRCRRKTLDVWQQKLANYYVERNFYSLPGVDQINYVVVLNAKLKSVSGNKEYKALCRNSQRPGSLKIGNV
jgi:ribosomal protein L13